MKLHTRFVPLTWKVNGIILVSLIVGIGTVTYFFYREVSNTIDEAVRDNLRRQSQILFNSIENFMIPGEAPLAVNFFNDIRNLNQDFEVRLYRALGEPAFHDNKTIIQVNNNIGRDVFKLRIEKPIAQGDMARKEGLSASMARPVRDAFLRYEEEGRTYITVYKPLINLPKCTGCHGSDHTVRGLIDIKTDISTAVEEQQKSLLLAGAFFFGAVLILTAGLSRFIGSGIIVPIRKIGEVCSLVTQGNFGRRVLIANNDEIGILGETVNTMVDGLHERFKLAKFVSSSTLKSLNDDSLTRKISLTVFFSDIRGFTSYSEKHTPEEVVSYLNLVLNAQTEIIHDEGGDVDKYVGDAVVAVFTGPEAERQAASAAVRIQKRFQQDAKIFGGLGVGIGITTGEVIMGLIGSQRRADYTVIGDTVNTSSRFCSAAKQGQTIVSEGVRRAVGRDAKAEGPYKLKVKGKDAYQKVYILEALQGELSWR